MTTLPSTLDLTTHCQVIICFVTFACFFMSVYCYSLKFFLSCLCTERINQIICPTDSSPDHFQRTQSVNDMLLDGAMGLEGSYWFTESDDPNKPLV
jgi:hypothetical protein